VAVKTETSSMPTRNLKRALNRLFIVATVAWALYCNVIFPAQRAGDALMRADEIYRLEGSQCAEKAIRDNSTEGLDACYKASEDALEFRRNEDSMRRVYAAYWPFILAATVGLPQSSTESSAGSQQCGSGCGGDTGRREPVGFGEAGFP
jgi:hypothetical protein